MDLYCFQWIFLTANLHGLPFLIRITVFMHINEMFKIPGSKRKNIFPEVDLSISALDRKLRSPPFLVLIEQLGSERKGYSKSSHLSLRISHLSRREQVLNIVFNIYCIYILINILNINQLHPFGHILQCLISTTSPSECVSNLSCRVQ